MVSLISKIKSCHCDVHNEFFMKLLRLSFAVIVLTLSSAVSASDFEEDKQYISCRKGAVSDRQLTICQERLLERLDMSIAKALDRNMTLLTESEKLTAQRYQSQWESWRQSHCDYSLRKQNDQQHLSLACYLQAAKDRLDMLEGVKLEPNSNFKVCLRRAGRIESHEILCRQEEYQRLENILFGIVQAAENSSLKPKDVLEEQLLWEKELAEKCKRSSFASIEQAASNYQCLCDEINKRIRFLTGTTKRPSR